MVHRSGVGPRGCPIAQLTEDKLVDALETLLAGETRLKAQSLGLKMREEDGVAVGIQSFYRNLPTENMLCEVSIFDNRSTRIARVYCPACGLKMANDVDAILHRPDGPRSNHNRVPFRAVRWGVVPPSSALGGLGQGVSVAMYEAAGGLYDLFAKPINGAAEGGVVGAGKGMAEGLVQFIARPIAGADMLVERVYTGVRGVKEEHLPDDDQLQLQRTPAECAFALLHKDKDKEKDSLAKESERAMSTSVAFDEEGIDPEVAQLEKVPTYTCTSISWYHENGKERILK